MPVNVTVYGAPKISNVAEIANKAPFLFRIPADIETEVDPDSPQLDFVYFLGTCLDDQS